MPQQENNSSNHIQLFGMQIDRIDLQAATRKVLDWCRQPRGEKCRFVVTPNVDHAVMIQHRADLRSAYDNAGMVIADGAPLVLASKILRRALPERVAGSDLVPSLFKVANQETKISNDETQAAPLRAYLLGAMPGVGDKAASNIEATWPGVQVVGVCSPPLGFEKDDKQNAAILAAIADVQPDVLLIGLGAPKQELWVNEHADQLQAKVALCIGATIDFLAGHRKRSPVWMQKLGLEWLHRVLKEPRRLASRYAHDAYVFPQLFWREWMNKGLGPSV